MDTFSEGQQTFHEAGNFAEARINREGNVIENVVLLGAVSKNKRRYGKAMQSAVERYDNAKVFFNHGDGARDVKEHLWGRVEHPRFHPEQNKMRGDIKVINHHETAFNLAEGAPDLIGFSHVARCKWKKATDGWTDIEEIEKVFSVDLVDEAGTTSGLFERLEKKDEPMEEIKTVEGLKERYPEFVDVIESAIKDDLSEKSEVEKLSAKLKESEATIAEQAKKIDENDEAVKAKEAETTLEAALKESRLSDKNKELIRERAKGKVFTEEEIKKEITQVEQICTNELQGVKGMDIPKTTTSEGNDTAKAMKKSVVGILGKLFGETPESKENETNKVKE